MPKLLCCSCPAVHKIRIFRADGKELLTEGLPAGTLPAVHYSAARRAFTFFYGEAKKLKAGAIFKLLKSEAA